MKVCFVVGTLAVGGAERQLVYMLRALLKAGVETKVLCLTREEAFEASIRDLGIEVEWVGASKSRIIRMMTIVSKIRKMRANVLQSSHFYTNIYAGAAGRLLGIPCIGAVRNDLKSELVANGMFGKWQLRLPGHLIANSNLAIARAEKLGINRNKLHFLGNVVKVENPKGQCQKAENYGIHILFVGRLVPQKNPELFVRLAARLTRDFPDRLLTFEVAGDGPLRGRLEQLVSESDFAANQFVFSGRVSNIDCVFQRADIFALTSDHEGMPNVVLEAMAHGIPVVATGVGGVPEILEFERGLLVRPSDLEGMVTAFAKLVSDPSLRQRLGESGRQYVGENHLPSDLGKKLSQIYANLTGGDRTDA